MFDSGSAGAAAHEAREIGNDLSLDMLTAEMPLGELVAYIGRYVKNRN